MGDRRSHPTPSGSAFDSLAPKATASSVWTVDKDVTRKQRASEKAPVSPNAKPSELPPPKDPTEGH